MLHLYIYGFLFNCYIFQTLTLSPHTWRGMMNSVSLRGSLAARPSCSTMTLRSNSSSGFGSTNFCGGKGPPSTRIQRGRRSFGPGRQDSWTLKGGLKLSGHGGSQPGTSTRSYSPRSLDRLQQT